MAQYDDASQNAPRRFQRLNDFSPVLNDHLSTARFQLASDKVNLAGSDQDRIYHSNNGFWEAVILGQLKRTDLKILLDSFFVFEWIPRAPGLYYTREGRQAREEAQKFVRGIENGILVYDPYGKESMLKGGIGNIRLKSILINNKEHFLLGASSDGMCNEGIPIAVPTEVYNSVIDEIVERGSIVRNIVGTIRQVPEELHDLYHGYKGVPKTYLKVEEVQNAAHPKSRSMEDLRVSVAVTFLSAFEGHPNFYASYVVFDPSQKGSFEENVKWMEDTYVNDFYKGVIVTDFDQTINNFSDATFSLSKVMDLKISSTDIKRLEKKLGYELHGILNTQNQITYIMAKYNIIGGQHGIVGDHGNIENLTQIQNSLSDDDVAKLASELQKLRAEAKKQADSGDHDIEIGALAAAETAAIQGDRSGLVEHLKKAGKWTFDIAVKVGTALAASVLKGILGLP